MIVTHLDPEDYTKLTKALTFTDTITTLPVSIDIEDDLVFEPTERFNISLSISSDGCAISLGNETIPVYIIDNGEIMHNAHCKCHVKCKCSYLCSMSQIYNEPVKVCYIVLPMSVCANQMFAW